MPNKASVFTPIMVDHKLCKLVWLGPEAERSKIILTRSTR
jgi:hypothetical protein